MYIVVYLRVYHSKDHGLEFEGPFLGPESETFDEAEEIAQRIVEEKPKAVMTPIKIYEFTGSYGQISDEANSYFNRYMEKCLTSFGLSAKPIMKSKNIGKKRKKKKKI